LLRALAVDLNFDFVLGVIADGASAACAPQSSVATPSDALGPCTGLRIAVAFCKQPGRLGIAIVAPSSLRRK
jgi:hypothetical protein